MTTLADQAARLMPLCSHYNMLTGEGFHTRRPFNPSVNGDREEPYTVCQGPLAFLIMRKVDGMGRVIRQRVGYPDGSSLLYEWDPKTGPTITTNDRKPVDTRACTLGVGCDEAGVCYAEAHGQPDQCGRISND
jgi:hypothetical protein